MRNTRAKGEEGESIAAIFLAEKGFSLVKRNFRSPRGEVDIIGEKGNLLVFVEVKYSDAYTFGQLEYIVNRKKQNKIINASKFFLAANHKYLEYSIRYDVIWLQNKGVIINHIPDAFTGTGVV